MRSSEVSFQHYFLICFVQQTDDPLNVVFSDLFPEIQWQEIQDMARSVSTDDFFEDEESSSPSDDSSSPSDSKETCYLNAKEEAKKRKNRIGQINHRNKKKAKRQKYKEILEQLKKHQENLMKELTKRMPLFNDIQCFTPDPYPVEAEKRKNMSRTKRAKAKNQEEKIKRVREKDSEAQARKKIRQEIDDKNLEKELKFFGKENKRLEKILSALPAPEATEVQLLEEAVKQYNPTCFEWNGKVFQILFIPTSSSDPQSSS